MKHLLRTAPAAVLTIMIVLASCSGKPPAASAAPAKEETVFAVNTTKAVTGELKTYLRVNADLQNASSVDVFPDAQGKVVKLNVVLGSIVQAGDVVAMIDPSKPGMEFVSSPVKAPISGTVVAVPASLGATVSSAIPLIRISRGTESRLVANISEKFIASIHTGLLGLADFEAFPGKVFTAHIVEVAPEVDPQSRTLQIKLQIDNPDPRIRVGMFSRVRLIVDDRSNVVKVPADAVVQRLGLSYVFVVHGFKVELRQVTLGVLIDGKQEIISGLRTGENIVIRGQTLLDDGAKINVIAEVTPLSVEDKVE